MSNKSIFIVFLFLFTLNFSINTNTDAKKVHIQQPSTTPVADLKITPTKEVIKLSNMDDILYKGQFFRDLFSEHLEPFKIQFGHVCENPNEWEQRFEQRNFETNNHRGKIKWGNKNGEYGEHYWDLNH